jgi:hypothetical protein
LVTITMTPTGVAGMASRVTASGHDRSRDWWPLTDDRSAALLVRVWLEDAAGTFRARVTAVGLNGSEDRTIALASSPDDVTAAVSEWLMKFSATGR